MQKQTTTNIERENTEKGSHRPGQELDTPQAKLVEIPGRKFAELGWSQLDLDGIGGKGRGVHFIHMMVLEGQVGYRLQVAAHKIRINDPDGRNAGE